MPLTRSFYLFFRNFAYNILHSTFNNYTMTMIKCPECRHHISSMAKACPECGAPIDPEWAKQEAEKELKKLEEVPFTINNLSPTPSEGTSSRSQEEGMNHLDEDLQEDGAQENDVNTSQSEYVSTPIPSREGKGGGSSKRWLYFLFLLLVLLLIGGIFYYDYRSGKQREQHAYEMLQDCSNPDFYEDFIIRYPKSQYIDEVRERYKVVAAQQQEWQNMIENGTRDDLRRFIREHPNSPYVKVAMGRVDSLDWAEAKGKRTLESVAQYIATHPDGYYIDHAEQLRQTLERQRAEALAAERDSLASDSAQTTSL